MSRLIAWTEGIVSAVVAATTWRRRMASVLAALTIGIASLALTPALAHAQMPRPWPANPVGILTNPETDLVLDVRGNSKDPRAAVQTFRFHGGDNQRWTIRNVSSEYVQIRSTNSDLCADVQWGSTIEEAPVWQWPCHGGSAQVWNVETFRIWVNGVRTVRFRNQNSGMCLTVVNNTSGFQLQQKNCVDGNTRQEFALTTSPPVAACATPSSSWPQFSPQRFRAAGNSNTFWHSTNSHSFWPGAGGFLSGDLLHFTASGTTQIATWGAHKGPNGDVNDLAPDNGRWPLPNAPKYGLLMRIRSGSAAGLSGRLTGRTIQPWTWFYIGSHSGCLIVKEPSPDIEFLINDDNIGDNNDGPEVIAQQWRHNPYYGK